MYLGIDLGTSAVKLVLVDEAQEIVASATRALAPRQPTPLWSEDDPAAWWAQTQAALDEVAASHKREMAAVRAIGLSGQMHGAVLLDAGDAVLRPAILWNDGRAHAEAAALEACGEALIDGVGVWPMPGITGPKFPWLRRHEPAVLDRLSVFMLPKDYLRLKLTGERATDVSDAAGTWLLDQVRRDWRPEALDACGVARDWLPRLVDSHVASGTLRRELAQRWGLRADVVVAGGAGDAAAGGVAIGAVSDGDAFISLGTSAQIFVAARKHRPASARLVHAFCHAAPHAWYQMAAMLSGASPLATAARWFATEDVAGLIAEAEHAYTGPSPPLFLPYLSGERTPHNDAYARGVFFGLDHATGRADMIQSVMEGVGFMLMDALESLASAGIHVDRASLIGGGARSNFFTRMLASMTNLTLTRAAASDRGPAFGAARLARLAHTGEDPAAVLVAPPVESVVAPDPALADAYRARLDGFQSLYRALRPEFRKALGA